MKLSQLDLNLFLVFDTIYAERNLTRAAEILSVTQPTVSNALARLRERFKDPLFVRTQRGMEPTAFAESLAGRVHGAMDLLASAAHPRQSFEPSRSQRVFRLSMIDWFESIALPGILSDLIAEAPGYGLRSYRTPRPEIARGLANGSIDFAIDVMLRDHADLRQTTLFTERYVCVLRPDHPLRSTPIGVDGYLSLDHIHVSSRSRGRGIADHALRKLGHRRRIKVRLQHFHAAAEIVRRSDMALTLTENMARQMGFECIDLPFDVPPVAFNLYWHRAYDNDPANRWLRDLIVARWRPSQG